MKRQKEKRLSLKVETLRKLDTVSDDALGLVVGGAARKSVQCNPTTDNPYA